MRYILTGCVVRHIAIKITRRLYGFRVALSYFQTRYDVYHVLSDDILSGDVCFELTGHSQRRRRETRGEMLLFVFGPSCVPYPGLVIPPGIPFNVSSSDRKDSSGARCSRERGTFQTIKFSRRADRQTALSRRIMP